MHRGLRWRLFLLTAHLLLLTVLGGCEGLQRKFTRKPAHVKPPTPIINFEDYTRAMTPVDRYRKHFMIFDYWNDDLLVALQSRSVNAKRLRRASSDALAELETLSSLLTDEMAARLAPLIEERARLDRQLQSGSFSAGDLSGMMRVLEAQARLIHRDLFWRDIEDHLKP